jgi:hypothetical protein
MPLRPTGIAIKAVPVVNLPQEKLNVGASIVIRGLLIGPEANLVML